MAHCRERGTSYACQLCELCHHVPDWQTSRFIHPMVPLEIGDGIVGRVPFKQTLTGALPDIRHFGARSWRLAHVAIQAGARSSDISRVEPMKDKPHY